MQIPKIYTIDYNGDGSVIFKRFLYKDIHIKTVAEIKESILGETYSSVGCSIFPKVNAFVTDVHIEDVEGEIEIKLVTYTFHSIKVEWEEVEEEVEEKRFLRKNRVKKIKANKGTYYWHTQEVKIFSKVEFVESSLPKLFIEE